MKQRWQQQGVTPSAAQAQTTPEGYQLQQVLMMSRHNLRA
ncbi:hypothetical protein QU864_26565, partial [Escherichia coli]|nr:hypothetical protein [Escherichia coli]